MGPYKIVRLMAPALAEVIAVYEQGKPRIVSLDILKDFRGGNDVHGLPSDPTHPSFQGGDETLGTGGRQRVRRSHRRLD